MDRSTLENFTKSAHDFIAYFGDRLLALVPHFFIAAQRSSYFKKSKANLACGEIVVQANFSENYSFVLQGISLEQLPSDNTSIHDILSSLQ